MKLRKTGTSFVSVVLAAAMLLGLPASVSAATSAELKEALDALEEQAAGYQEQLDALKEEQDANWDSIEEMVAYKNNIDEQTFLLYSQIENINQQITSYAGLIAQTQADLDAAERELEELNVKYKERIRAMEEEGSISYWSVLFKANSFTDLIDRLNMMQEIAEADQRMFAELEQAAEEVRQAKEQLVQEKSSLEESRTVQQQAQADLEILRSEADEVLIQLNAERMELEDQEAEIAAEKAALADEIAQAEAAYTKKLQEEEEARRQAEEAKRKAEEAAKQAAASAGSSSGGTTSYIPSNGATWLQPCSYICISSSYGYRSSGWHNGVDFAANRGTPIYASRSGTVTTVRSLNYSYGNYVVINHGDGFSSLYAHMDYYVVSQGEYVVQGQLIGYVGSTGNSSGPHLHFTIFYNGSTVNPMGYL